MLRPPTVTASVAGLSRAPLQAGARHLAHVPLVLLPRPLALRPLVAPLDPRDHALVVGGVLALAAVAVAVLDGDLAAGAVEDHLLLLGGELRPRRVEVDVVGVGDGLQHPREVLRLRRSPRRDRPGVDRQVGVGDDEFGIDLERRAEPVTRLTGAVGRVEREVPRCRLVVAAPARRAGQMLGERHRLVLGSARLRPRPRPTISTSATPSARRSAVSSESVRRRSIPSRCTSRSMMTSILCCS